MRLPFEGFSQLQRLDGGFNSHHRVGSSTLARDQSKAVKKFFFHTASMEHARALETLELFRSSALKSVEKETHKGVTARDRLANAKITREDSSFYFNVTLCSFAVANLPFVYY